MTIHGKHTIAKLAVSTLLAMLFITGFAVTGAFSAKASGISPESTQFLGKLSNALAEIAQESRPAVVNISTTSTMTMAESPFGDMFNDPLFRRFFGEQFEHPGHKQQHYQSSALGSGVIVSDQGYILTNNHVIKGADKIKVVLYDKREFTGKVVGADPRTDLAVVKIDAKDLPTIPLGASGKLKIGDIVLAIGNPFGLNQTTTMGIVSAVGRSDVGIADFEDFIQTDAAINPGNSGGALVNDSGELVGINTAIFSTSGGYMGVGFAIPSDMAKSVMESIIKSGKVIRGWMGVSIQNLTPELAESLGLKGKKGALISGVENGSPADKAGLKRGDLVIMLDGKKIEDPTSLRNQVSSAAPGTKADISVIREGKEKSITVALDEYHEKKVEKKTEFNNVLNGITTQELTPSLRDRMNLSADINGVVITNVGPESQAHGLLQPNDIIEEVNRTPIQNAQEYEGAVSKIGEKDTVLLLVHRNGGSVYLTITP